MIMFTRWNELRTKGRVWFIWHYGILRFSLPAGALLAIGVFSVERGFSVRALWSLEFLNELVWKLLIFVPLIGYRFGASFWRIGESGYRSDPRE